MVKHWDMKQDFFKSNSHLVVLLGSFIKEKLSNKLMWAIAHYCDKSSPLNHLDDTNKRLAIEENLLGYKLDWVNYEEHIARYNELTKDRDRRLLDEWLASWEKRRLFMKDIEYSPATFEMLEKMMANNYKLFKEYLEIQSRLLETGEDNEAMGGTMESLTEQNLI